jgi:hypothetical protein
VEVEVELIIMSLAGSLVAFCLHLSDFIGRGIAHAPAHTLPAIGGRAAVWRGPAQAAWRTTFLLAATALLHALRPIPALGSELPAAVSLSQTPLVMRLSKDEFRLAFGISSVGCTAIGCHGAIHYRVNWRTEDGTIRSGLREVDYKVLPHDVRSIAVDRQYFDTAEDAHTTDVVDVTVTHITCHTGTETRVLSAADHTGSAQQHRRDTEVVPMPQQQ